MTEGNGVMTPGEVTRSLQRIEGQLQAMSGRMDEDFRSQRHKTAGIDTAVAALVEAFKGMRETFDTELTDFKDAEKEVHERFKADITRIESAQIAFRNLLLITMVGLIGNVAVVLITRNPTP